METLGADRIRHGIRAVEDPALVRELADRRTVLDVCPISNLRTGAVASLAEHPLPTLIGAGIPCSLSTDDPAMFDTDLGREYDAATAIGLSPRGFFDAGVEGALCDEATKEELRRIGASYDWDEPEHRSPGP
jgi:aminodeoxyfutalosine deaminase